MYWYNKIYISVFIQSFDGHYSNYVIVILMLLLITVANDICQTNFKHHRFHCLLPTYSIYLYIFSFIFLMYINTLFELKTMHLIIMNTILNIKHLISYIYII